MTCTCLVLQWIHAHASVHGGVDFTRFSHVKVDLGSRARCRVLFTPGNLGIISMGPCIWYSFVATVATAVGWTACGFRACIVEKYVWFSAVLHVADESGSALVHGVASVTADRLAPNCRVFGGATISRTRARRPSGRYAAWDVVTSCLESFILLFCYAGLQFPASDDYDTVRTCEGHRFQGRSGVFRYKHFVVFRRVRLPHEGSVELSAPLSVEDTGSVEPQFR